MINTLSARICASCFSTEPKRYENDVYNVLRGIEPPAGRREVDWQRSRLPLLLCMESNPDAPDRLVQPDKLYVGNLPPEISMLVVRFAECNAYGTNAQFQSRPP